jgi:hypothetical protein
MKSFLSNNWYKLMVASSLFIFSVGFFIYAVSPSYANTEKTNTTMKESKEPNGSAFYSDFIVVNGNLYGLRKEKSGYYKSDWLLLWQ